MLSGNRVLSALVVGIAAAFIFGLVYLFQLRYEAGDVYPAYSSLRADPLGTKAFFESLERVGDIRVERNLFDLHKLDLPRSTTLFYVGLKAEDLNHVEEQEFKQWQDLVLGGGRLVLCFRPSRIKAPAEEQAHQRNARPGELDENADQSKNAPESRQRSERRRQLRRLREGLELLSKTYAVPGERWGFQVASHELPRDQKGGLEGVTVERRTDAPSPLELAWHSPMVFSELQAAWQTIYARGAWPVLIEKRHGRGSIVLLADSYLLSNEALRLDRQPELLAWLVGRGPTVIFDETHLGIIKNPGVMALARKYRLHGLFIGLALLASLVVWKNALTFVPEQVESTVELPRDQVGGRDSTAGFVNMLRRSVTAPNLSRVCFEQWKAAHAREKAPGKFERMEAIVQAEEARPPRDRDPVRAYQQLARIWNE